MNIERLRRARKRVCFFSPLRSMLGLARLTYVSTLTLANPQQHRASSPLFEKAGRNGIKKANYFRKIVLIIERLRRIRNRSLLFLFLALHVGFAQGAVFKYSTPFAKHDSIGHPPHFFPSQPSNLPRENHTQPIKLLNEKIRAVAPRP